MRAVILFTLLVAIARANEQIFEAEEFNPSLLQSTPYGFPMDVSNVAVDANAYEMLGQSLRCCEPDIMFLIDITDNIGFSRAEAENQVRDFMVETLARARQHFCDETRIALVEYGRVARLRYDFNEYTSYDEQRQALQTYSPGSTVGEINHARSAFTAARALIQDDFRGHRQGSPIWVFWLTKSTPFEIDTLHSYVNVFIKPQSFLVLVATGYDIDYDRTRHLASGRNFDFWVTDVRWLTGVCSKFYFDWCPSNPTTTVPNPTTRTTRRTTRRTTTRRTTTRRTTTRRTTVPNPTTRTTRRTTRYTKPTTRWTPRPTTTRRTTVPNPTTRTTRRTTRYTKPTTRWTPRPTTTRRTTTRRTTVPNPTTRTTRRTTTTRVPNPTTPANDFCMQCRERRNHKDLYEDPVDCHYYYQCSFYNETSTIGIRRRCADGLFWHDEILQCMPEGDTPCVDACREDSTAARGCYAGDSCRQYFVCANTASYGMCCDEGTQFNPETCGCDHSDTCTDFCEQSGPAIATTVRAPEQINSSVCLDSFGTPIAVLPDEPNAYILIGEDGSATEKMYCPEYIAFNFETCRCDIESGVTPPSAPEKRSCLAWLPFDQDTRDYSVHRWETFVYDGAEQTTVDFAQGGGSFSPNGGHLEIPGLKTYDFRASGSWAAFFKCDGNDCNVDGGILSNNKDNSASEYTIIVSVRSGNRVSARLNFWHPVSAQSVESAASQASNGWVHVCVTYNGNTITLYVNGEVVQTVFVSGYLQVAHCPLAIGHDQTYGPFNGLIDDVLITSFEMTVSEIEAHRNGDRGYLQSLGFF